jgi:predicted MFS family arabinose efflux permease
MTPSPWRNPLVLLACLGIIVSLSMGMRQTFGLFLAPMTAAQGWSRETFGIAIALQNLMMGAAAPVVGWIADRKGTGQVMLFGGVLYAMGIVLTAFATSGWQLSIAAGLLIGVAQACTTFTVAFGMLGRVVPPERRSRIFGIMGAAGSFGQFILLPYAGSLIATLGWFNALIAMSITIALIVPVAACMMEPAPAAVGRGPRTQSGSEALREAFGHRGFVLMTTGYFVCGFQLAFITLHLPAYLADTGFALNVATVALALIGLFNIFGSYAAGELGQRYPKKYLLSGLYFIRSLSIALFLVLPKSEGSVYVLAAILGLLWLATGPLTSALIAQMFGTAYLTTLSGLAFFSHQLGGALGAWLGGHLYDRTGSYAVIWVVSVGLGLFAALVNLPIDERTVKRAPQSA